MAKRKYTQRKRAEQQDLTRQRIVEATMALHEELGAARTTISAVAEEAGVQRLTVYRHFPDEARLLEACTTRWLELHPMPTASDWEEKTEPLERIRTAVEAFHSYYAGTRAMWESSYRDRDLLPELDARMELVDAQLEEVAAALVKPLRLRGARRQFALATIRHGLEFSTWRSLLAIGVEDAGRSAELVLGWVSASAGDSGLNAGSRNHA